MAKILGKFLLMNMDYFHQSMIEERKQQEILQVIAFATDLL